MEGAWNPPNPREYGVKGLLKLVYALGAGIWNAGEMQGGFGASHIVDEQTTGCGLWELEFRMSSM